MTNYSRWINDVASCYNPESDSMLNYRMFSSLADADRDAAKFVKLAMSPVDDSYTQRSKQAGNNVRDWLKSKQTNKRGLCISRFCDDEYPYQGL